MVLQRSGIHREGNIWWGGGGIWAQEAARSAPPAPAFPGPDREERPGWPACAEEAAPPPGASCCERSPSHAISPWSYHPSTYSTLPGTDRASQDEKEAQGCGLSREVASVPVSTDSVVAGTAHHPLHSRPCPAPRQRRPKPQQGPRDIFTPFSFSSEFSWLFKKLVLDLWCLSIQPTEQLTPGRREN